MFTALAKQSCQALFFNLNHERM